MTTSSTCTTPKLLPKAAPKLVEDFEIGHGRGGGLGDGQDHRIIGGGTVCMMELSMPASAPVRETFPPLAADTPGWAPKTISVRPTRI